MIYFEQFVKRRSSLPQTALPVRSDCGICCGKASESDRLGNLSIWRTSTVVLLVVALFACNPPCCHHSFPRTGEPGLRMMDCRIGGEQIGTLEFSQNESPTSIDGRIYLSGIDRSPFDSSRHSKSSIRQLFLPCSKIYPPLTAFRCDASKPNSRCDNWGIFSDLVILESKYGHSGCKLACVYACTFNASWATVLCSATPANSGIV